MSRLCYRIRTHAFRIASALLMVVLAAPIAKSQVNWVESGDAGHVPQQAQITVGTGPLLSISGGLFSDYDADMYCIKIVNEAAFLAGLQCVIMQGPNVFLFDATGLGVAMNGTCMGGMKQLTSTFVTSPGNHLIAVAHYGWWPGSFPAGSIWQPGIFPERAPDGPGAAGLQNGWGGLPVPGPINPYSISLSGCEPCDAAVPVEPSTWGKIKALYR